MGYFANIVRGISASNAMQAAMISSCLLVVGALLWQVPVQSQTQLDNTYWQQMALRFDQSRTAPQTGAIVLQQSRFGKVDERGFETFTKAHIELAFEEIAQIDCLTTAIYYEARSESLSGQMAVAQVVLNRVKSKHYPSTICDVVYEGSSRTTGCQFSFTCDGSLARLPSSKAWERSRQSAVHVALGMSDVTIGKATHYHTVAINPIWSSSLLKTADVGSHVFYRFPNRREKRAMASEI